MQTKQLKITVPHLCEREKCHFFILLLVITGSYTHHLFGFSLPTLHSKEDECSICNFPKPNANVQKSSVLMGRPRFSDSTSSFTSSPPLKTSAILQKVPRVKPLRNATSSLNFCSEFKVEAGEMAQLLRPLTAPAEDLGSDSLHCLQLQLLGMWSWTGLWAPPHKWHEIKWHTHKSLFYELRTGPRKFYSR